MDDQNKLGPTLPPLNQRRIIVPGEPNPGMGLITPGAPQVSRIPVSGKPLTIAIAFVPPPQLIDTPPTGVFWVLPDGGMLLSGAIGLPAKLENAPLAPQDEASQDEPQEKIEPKDNDR